MEIYWEHQQGNNCRIHSLNAMFGTKFLNETRFRQECNEYDKIIEGLNSIDMDGFAECRSITSYIINKYTGRFTLLVPINLNGINNKNRNQWNYNRLIRYLDGHSISEYFEFNKGHIWYNKYINGKWYKIDSLSGVNIQNKPRQFSNNGYILIFESNLIFKELKYIFNFIKVKLINLRQTEKDEFLEIAYYNLYHLLKLIKLDFIENDSIFNSQISLLRSLFKTLKNYISIQRKQKRDTVKLKQVNIELVNIIKLL